MIKKRIKFKEDHHDDCGDALGDLEYLLYEPISWEENVDNEVQSQIFYDSSFDFSDVTFWPGESRQDQLALVTRRV